jgi:serine/threonine protein kinase
MLPPTSTDTPTTFGAYVLYERIGQGGMAQVHLARDARRLGVHRVVAVKRIHRHLAHEQAFVDMFQDEAHIASQVCHPNVCAVFDHGVERGTPYLAMEYLCGEPLSHVRDIFCASEVPAGLREGLIARMLADAAEGLHALHELRTHDGRSLDVVHRDVSPDNLFLTCNGVVKVMDLGLVKANSVIHGSSTEVIKGKLAYLAPEVLERKSLDRRADIWALGVIAWELLTGRRLFRRKSDQKTLRAIARARIAAPSYFCPSLPAAVDAVVMKALSRDPSARYETARCFGRALLAAAGKRVDHGDVQHWLQDRFGHDASCLQRRAERVVRCDEITKRVIAPPSADEAPAAVAPRRTGGSRLRRTVVAVAATAAVALAGSCLLVPSADAAPQASARAWYVVVVDASGEARFKVPLTELVQRQRAAEAEETRSEEPSTARAGQP